MNWKNQEAQMVNTISNRQVKDVKKEKSQKRSDKASLNAKIKEDKRRASYYALLGKTSSLSHFVWRYDSSRNY